MEQTSNKISPMQNNSLSLESLFVAFVFFVVLSQVFFNAPESITQPLRPMIVLILTVQVVRRGRLHLAVCNLALIMAVYQMLVWFFLYPSGGGLMEYMALVFYYMMLFSVAGFPWNRRELQLILYVTFLATFVCALIFVFSNDMSDVSVHDFYFLGQLVNRNKNAYAFGFGVALGSAYLFDGKGRNRFIILLMTLLELYCLLYSQCRGAFIGVVLALSTVVVHRIFRRMRENDPFALLYLLLFIITIIIGFFLIKSSMFSRLLDNENFSGRDVSIQYALDRFLEAPVLGKIFGNGFLYETLGTEKIGAHMVYINYLLESGVVGMLLIILVFLTALVNVRGELQCTVFIIAFSRTFFEGMDYYIFIPLILTICMSNYSRMFGRNSEELLWSPHYEIKPVRYKQIQHNDE